jgi:dienelactone hydrolase
MQARWFIVLFAGAIGVLAATSAPFYPDKANLLVLRDADGKETPIRTAEQWATRREHILAGMQEAMGPLPDTKKAPLDVKYTGEERTEKYTRKQLTYAGLDGDRVPAYLLIPHEVKGRAAGILCLHQTNGNLGKKEPAGLGGSANLHYAHHLAERGHVCLVPDYPSFGEYVYDFKKSSLPSGTMVAIANNIRGVDLLQSLPEVDPKRIGVIGHSLGGHNAMYTAAFDTRIQAIVSNCGFNAFPKYYGGKLAGWTSDRYMPRIATKYNNDPKKVPFDFPEVVASFAPRAFLASSPTRDGNFEVSGVRDCIAAATPVYELLQAKDKLAANYPDCGHDFPPEVRKVAYEWLEKWLK